MPSSAILINNRHRQMVDDVMTAYVKWREAALRVREAYRSWQTAGHADSDGAFPAYTAALDHEQRASEIYAGLVTELERLDGARHRGRRRAGS